MREFKGDDIFADLVVSYVIGVIFSSGAFICAAISCDWYYNEYQTPCGIQVGLIVSSVLTASAIAVTDYFYFPKSAAKVALMFVLGQIFGAFLASQTDLVRSLLEKYSFGGVYVEGTSNQLCINTILYSGIALLAVIFYKFLIHTQPQNIEH
jgi:hypothetical protein